MINFVRYAFAALVILALAALPAGAQVPDATPPVVTCGTADGTWHAVDAVIACTASDPESGIPNPSDQAFDLTTSVPAGTETNDAATGTREVCNGGTSDSLFDGGSDRRGTWSTRRRPSSCVGPRAPPGGRRMLRSPARRPTAARTSPTPARRASRCRRTSQRGRRRATHSRTRSPCATTSQTARRPGPSAETRSTRARRPTRPRSGAPTAAPAFGSAIAVSPWLSRLEATWVAASTASRSASRRTPGRSRTWPRIVSRPRAASRADCSETAAGTSTSPPATTSATGAARPHRGPYLIDFARPSVRALSASGKTGRTLAPALSNGRQQHPNPREGHGLERRVARRILEPADGSRPVGDDPGDLLATARGSQLLVLRQRLGSGREHAPQLCRHRRHVAGAFGRRRRGWRRLPSKLHRAVPQPGRLRLRLRGRKW